VRFLILITAFMLASCSNEPQVTLKCEGENNNGFEINNFLSKDHVNEDWLYKKSSTQYFHYEEINPYMVMEVIEPPMCLSPCDPEIAALNERELRQYTVIRGIYKRGEPSWQYSTTYKIDKGTLEYYVVNYKKNEYGLKVESNRSKWGNCTII